MLTNSTSFAGKRVAVGVCGGIAAYKVVSVVSALVQAGALVDVLMTEGAQRFITPVTFAGITHRPVHTDPYAMDNSGAIAHIEIARNAEVFLIAPATAHTIAKLAHGLADDPVTLTVLASAAPVLICPAMDGGMYANPATQANIAILRARGMHVAGPASGRLASGHVGVGRLIEPDQMVDACASLLRRTTDLTGRSVVVTAGATQEPIDPVRFIGNRSSGKMGYAIAQEAAERGANVTLVAGPTALAIPAGVRLVPIRTVADLRSALHAELPRTDVLIQAAAVSDYRVADPATHKIKRTGDEVVLRLIENPDLIAEIGQLPDRPLLVGFAAETSAAVENARTKLLAKNLDLIVLNDVGKPGSGFEVDTNEVTFIGRDGPPESLPLMSKREVAAHLITRVVALLHARGVSPQS